MITFKQYLEESAGLHVFDIDNTLLKTNACVLVRNRGGRIIRKLTNQEYNDHWLKPGQTYDFKEFRDAKKFRNESLPIHPMIKKLNVIQRNIERGKHKSKVIMSTAREDLDNKNEVLAKFRDHGVRIDQMHIHRAGNLPGEDHPGIKKNEVLRKHLNTGQFRHACMYDDSKTNLQYFLALRNEYPNIKFKAWHVDDEGKAHRFMA